MVLIIAYSLTGYNKENTKVNIQKNHYYKRKNKHGKYVSVKVDNI